MTQSQAWLLIVVGLILAGLLYILQPVLTPFLVGIGIAYLADPFADRLEARGWPRSMATVMVFSVLILLLVGLFLGIYPLLIKQIQTSGFGFRQLNRRSSFRLKLTRFRRRDQLALHV